MALSPENKFPVHTEVFKTKTPMKEAKTKTGQRRLVSPALRPIREAYNYNPINLPEGWQDKVLEELRMEPNLSRAAREAGVSRRTVSRYREVDAEFDSAVKDAIEEGRDKAEEILFELFKNGNAVAGMQLLRFWRYGGQDIAKPKDDKKVVVGWE